MRRRWKLAAWAMGLWVALRASQAGALSPVPESYVTQTGGWLRLEYPTSARHRIPALLDEADAVRAELADVLGRPVLWQARVRLATNPAELSTLLPAPLATEAVSAAHPEDELVGVSLTDATGAELDAGRALRRELAYLAFHEATAGHLPPQWFLVGFAASMEGDASLGAKTLPLVRAALFGELVPLAQLDRVLREPGTKRLATAEARAFVEYLRTRGPTAFTTLVERLRTGEAFPNALEASYGASLSELEQAFRDQTSLRYGYLPFLAIVGLVGASSFGLSAWRGARRRRKEHELPAQEPHELPVEVLHDFPEPYRGRVRIKVRARPAEGTTAIELDVPKVAHKGRWHTLH